MGSLTRSTTNSGCCINQTSLDKQDRRSTQDKTPLCCIVSNDAVTEECRASRNDPHTIHATLIKTGYGPDVLIPSVFAFHAYWYTNIRLYLNTRFPFGMWVTWSPRMSQVENGDAGKTLAPLFGVKMVLKSNELWTTAVLLNGNSSSPFIDALAHLVM